MVMRDVKEMRKTVFGHWLMWKEEKGSSQLWPPGFGPQIEEEGTGLGHEKKSREGKN